MFREDTRFLCGRTTKVREPSPLDLSGSWGFGNFFLKIEKVFFVVQGVEPTLS